MIAPQSDPQIPSDTSSEAVPSSSSPRGASTLAREQSRALQKPARGADHETGLLLGWKHPEQQADFGFANRAVTSAVDMEPLLYSGDGHAMTVAPTGAGKGVGSLIPNLLHYPGSMIVVDPKGENCQVTARRRREMGHKVVILDPFHQVTTKSDSLNPMDLFQLPGSFTDSDAEMLAEQMAAGHMMENDPYWNDMATPLTGGVIAHIATTSPPAERNLNKVREVFYHDDMDYQIAVWLDSKAITCKMAREEFVSYLSIPSEKTRPCVRSTATAYIKCLGSENVAETLEKSSFDLHDLLEGKPITIYIVIPPEKLESHRALLRLWVGTLLTTVIRRKRLPKKRTLFLLDEAAQLGTFPLLRQAITLYRGYGMQVWSFWQDLSQLQRLYPKDWETMLNNAAAVQIFGVYNNLIAQQWGDILGVASAELLSMPMEDAMVQLHREGVTRCRRASYLHDRQFEGQFDPNKRFLSLTGTER